MTTMAMACCVGEEGVAKLYVLMGRRIGSIAAMML